MADSVSSTLKNDFTDLLASMWGVLTNFVSIPNFYLIIGAFTALFPGLRKTRKMLERIIDPNGRKS
jgi:hypothetical protein